MSRSRGTKHLARWEALFLSMCDSSTMAQPNWEAASRPAFTRIGAKPYVHTTAWVSG